MTSGEVRATAQHGSVYPLPYHDGERQRLKKQHNGLMGIMHNEPIHSPISSLRPKKIVDVGCGINADMTMYFAKRFPDAQIYGVDLARVDMPREQIPPNVVFIQGNITTLVNSDPRLASGSVDFLYSRLLASGMQDWRAYIQCVTSLLRAGGILEMHDLAGLTLMEGEVPAFEESKWSRYYRENGVKKLGLDMEFDKADVIMKGLGLKDVSIKQYRLPWGAAKEESEHAWDSEGRAQWYAALVMFMTNLVSDEEQAVRDEILAEFHGQASPPREGLYFPFYVAWGSKP
ncbi:uncharacterized protein RCC_08373 [Ramularia collo-cygni]|uniref:Methyltransferase type 11 domain-containing protein n=1 Tax=Ramularia collo-cygni TaxID=112498 RepID=A0A2D3VM79_9PEZI|nr:uncharacterized protein RCC_08373 [Ramularia collo-cygni]CZT22668.1 uncharacterized protein RCC_08373 [Ramularia collo-cygni]